MGDANKAGGNGDFRNPHCKGSAGGSPATKAAGTKPKPSPTKGIGGRKSSY